MPSRHVVNHLCSFFYSDDEELRRRAVIAAGCVAQKIAEQDRERARVIMRRLMWSLNDESGGIGWGAAEAMAEIMVRDRGLAEEYSAIFASYLNEKGSFLEYDALQRGLLWGVARLASARPETLRDAVPHLAKYLESRDATVRGRAAQAAGLLGAEQFRPNLEALLNDEAEFSSFDERTLERRKVREAAEEALTRLDAKKADL